MIIFRVTVQYKDGMPDHRSFWFGSKLQAKVFRYKLLHGSDESGHTRTGHVIPVPICTHGRPSNQEIAEWLTKQRVS